MTQAYYAPCHPACTKYGSSKRGLTCLLIHGACARWLSTSTADKAERRFRQRLADYRAGHRAPPEEWRVPGTCLAEVLGAAAE
jgi:hypothetical protein